jgi:hypothetical protein
MMANTSANCLEGKNVWLVGESHMRQNWEYLLLLNFEKARKDFAYLTRSQANILCETDSGKTR